MSKANEKHSDQKAESSSNSGQDYNPNHNGELLVHPESLNFGSQHSPITLNPPAASSPDSKAVLNALRRKWFSALFLGLIFGISGGLTAWFLVPAPYTAYRDLHIKSVRERILFHTAEPDTKFEIYKNTQMKQAKSPLVLSKALSDPKLQGLSLIQQVQKRMRPRIWLEKELKVASPAEEFIRISLSGNEPEGLAEIVNAVTESYFENIFNIETVTRIEQRDKLKKIRDEHEARLSSKRRDLRTLARQLNTTNSETIVLKQQMEIEYFSELRKHLIQVFIDLGKAKSQSPEQDPKNPQILTQAESKATDFQNELLKNNQSLIERQIEQRSEFIEEEHRIKQLEALIAQYNNVADNYPRLVELKNKVKTQKTDLENLRKKLRVDIVEELRLQVTNQNGISDFALKQKINQKINTLESLKIYLETALENQKIVEQTTGQNSIELEEKQRAIAQDEKMFEEIDDEFHRREIELNARPRIDPGFPAETPVEKNNDNKYIITAFSGIGMFSLFFAGIVWIELRIGRISGIEEVAGNLNLRVIGSLPQIPRSAINSSSRRRRSRNNDWQRILSESIDSTRTMLLREADRETMKLVMITSALPSEGKTTLSSHLATSLVRAGRKVLLIDCDLRRPRIHNVFDSSLTPGLSEHLRGEADLDEVICPTSQEGLWILPAGDVDENVYQILAQGGIENVFQQAKQEFDFVIVDSSPVLPVTDTLMIAQHADAVLFSIRRDVSQAAKVAAAMDRMERLGVPVLGSVVIGLEKEAYGVSYAYASRSTFH